MNFANMQVDRSDGAQFDSSLIEPKSTFNGSGDQENNIKTDENKNNN